MLKVEGPIVVEHQLSERTINILRRLVQGNIEYIVEPKNGWLLGDTPLPRDFQDKLSIRLKKLGYSLYMGEDGFGTRNATLIFQKVILHNDTDLRYKHSPLFIPLTIPEGTTFLAQDKTGIFQEIPIKNGDIVAFNGHKLHKVCFPETVEKAKKADESLKIGITLFLDKI